MKRQFLRVAFFQIIFSMVVLVPSLSAYQGGIRIAWDYSTAVKIFGPHAGYSRIIRLSNDDLLCSFFYNGSAQVTRSTDNGKTWQPHTTAAFWENDIAADVPELLQLQNSRVLLAYNLRPSWQNSDPSKRFGIAVTASDDDGETWQHLSDVYSASHLFLDGVWEPAMIQLESGEVQLFVSNEFPYQTTDEQEITLFRSFDNGASWSDTVTVSFRAGSRDGMAVPLILQNQKGIVFSIEDNGGSDHAFKPTIIWSSEEDNWQQGFADAFGSAETEVRPGDCPGPHSPGCDDQGGE